MFLWEKNLFQDLNLRLESLVNERKYFYKARELAWDHLNL